MEQSASNIFKAIDEDVSHERLDGEVIAINLKTGHYYSMSGPAADVWMLMCAGISEEKWKAILEKAFNTSVSEDDFAEFSQDCIAAGLIEYATQFVTGDFDLPTDYVRSTWTKPRLEEFDDMRDLILVDPIHDTTLLGWPHVK